MGGLWTSLWNWTWGQPTKLVMVGLDGAGKTTILYRLKLGESAPTIPTIGFNVERVAVNGTDCTVWDVGGQSRLRSLWAHYLQGTDVLVFVVDAQDRERLGEARSELARLLAEPMLVESALLLLANKQDLPNAADADDIIHQVLTPETREGRPWRVQLCCASTGDGLDQGLRWVTETREKRAGLWWG